MILTSPQKGRLVSLSVVQITARYPMFCSRLCKSPNLRSLCREKMIFGGEILSSHR